MLSYLELIVVTLIFNLDIGCIFKTLSIELLHLLFFICFLFITCKSQLYNDKVILERSPTTDIHGLSKVTNLTDVTSILR